MASNGGRLLSDLCLLLWELHIVKNAEHNPEEILPPMPLKCVSISLHDLKHYCEASVKSRQTFLKCDCNNGQNTTHKK